MPGEADRLEIAVAGAGTMGHGLAIVMARAGHNVALLDTEKEILEKALEPIRWHLDMLREEGLEKRPVEDILARIKTTTEKEVIAGADLVIESVSEDPGIKRSFYRGVAELCRPDAVIASNTSYLNIFELAPSAIQQRLLISHFYAPPYLIPLVEIVKGPETRADLVEWMKSLLAEAGQEPVVIEKFIPGFIVNRLQRAMGKEIFHLIDEGYARPEEIDRAVLSSLGIRLPVLGVVRRFDFAGLDFTQKVLSNPSINLVSRDRPSKAIDDLVAQGRLGVKSGKGFYDYGGLDEKEIYRKRDRLLIRMRGLIREIKHTFWSDFNE
ncbi:MAG: 3-hydroxyacyl-CoA dehydrogenase family protein [Desulfobacteraceae bacterium]|nr:3-hydroxyacyl-CoA dehydrogenase family protein [Desulfobacteraceae bacterium]